MNTQRKDDTMKISVPAPLDRYNEDGSKAITTLEGWGEFFSPDELVEIIHRWCNTADASRKYRQSAADQAKALREWAKAQGINPADLVK